MNNSIKHFIIIDDDSVNNMICKMVINAALPSASVRTYTHAKEALMGVKADFTSPQKEKVIVFLDINMPEMSGWDFLQALEENEHLIHEGFMIFMASSSVNPEDKQRANSNPHVIDFIEKPLTKEIVLKLSSNYLTV